MPEQVHFLHLLKQLYTNNAKLFTTQSYAMPYFKTSEVGKLPQIKSVLLLIKSIEVSQIPVWSESRTVLNNLFSAAIVVFYDF